MSKKLLVSAVLLPAVAAWAPAASLSARPQPFAASARRAVGAPSRTMQHALTAMAGAPFNQTKAVLAAGFAFEAYNEPAEQDARWERGADGCDVAFMSENFAREVYAGRLEVRLCEAKELTTDQDLAQTLMSGGQRDPYVIFALNEENDKGPKEGAIGLGRAVVRSARLPACTRCAASLPLQSPPTEAAASLCHASQDRARSSTVWSKSVADQAKEGLQAFLKPNCTRPARAVHAPCTRRARAMHAPCTRHAHAVHVRHSSSPRSRPQRAAPHGLTRSSSRFMSRTRHGHSSRWYAPVSRWRPSASTCSAAPLLGL